jgi:hypothetical protein
LFISETSEAEACPAWNPNVLPMKVQLSIAAVVGKVEVKAKNPSSIKTPL